MVHPSRIPGSEQRLGEPWIYFSRRDKIYSVLAIIGIIVLINVAFGTLGTQPIDPDAEPTTTVSGAEG